MNDDRELLRVCRIGRAQGLKGEVNVRAFTDDPGRRFSAGSRLISKDGRTFTVEKSRNFKQRWILKFDQVPDRTAAEALNSLTLYIDAKAEADGFVPASDVGLTSGPVTGLDAGSAEDDPSQDDDWYPDQLIGLEILQVDDSAAAKAADYDGVEAHLIGHASDLDLDSPQTLLQIELTDGRKVLLPFVEELVPIVDSDEGYILIDPPAGLFDL
ncbi:16S rRNA processing protein rimM [Parascardovia denticolens IPLA 20019]|uniref:ribosome maturation factor RimM n=1 Tax=Parascardovia denticolens TaxID=78258 RepID=UPI000266A933|nr:ribosome maturation factor RimM [Parascardovia denticolens]EIT88918.1 16S rRNA processing protein rimM [Parascardovia denticolens IPLA 20019]